jgi:CubicO group peptidase (beta-lactamase class C family)
MSSGGLSKERLQQMHRVLAAYVERGDIPGILTMICRRDAVYVDAIGSLTLGGREPICRDTIFRLASMTKPITAVATMALVEDCRLGLDDPVDDWLPELANRRVLKRIDGPVDDTVAAARSITVRDLLTCRMGFGHIWEPSDRYPILMLADQIGLDALGPRAPSPDEWIRRLGTLPLMHQPGDKWMYNTSSDVLGVLIARAANQPFESFLRERLFEPLGMKDSGFSVPPEQLHRLPTSYWTGFDLSASNFRIDWCSPVTTSLDIFDPRGDSLWSRAPRFPSGASGLVSTADDYLAFAQMLLNGGIHNGERVLSRGAVETMTSDQLTSEQRARSGYFPGFFADRSWGFGVSVVTRRDHPSRPVGKFGWDGGLGTSWYSDPSEQMTGILMTQRGWTAPSPPAVCRDFWTLAYGAIDD